MTKPAVSHRRIDQLKTVAFDLGFTNEDARKFGKLSKTDTWQKLFRAHGISGDSFFSQFNDYPTPDPVEVAVNSTVDSRKPIDFLEWVDFSQLIALTLTSVGLFMLLTSVWTHNPLKFLPSPIRITIQIGAK
jgi:hypothetical protein